jgi:hypothetical protein
MLGKNWTRKSLAILTTFAVWCVFTMVASAAPKDLSAETAPLRRELIQAPL